MSYPRIDLVVGTRPEAIKLAPIAFALAAEGGLPLLLFTGQHPLDPADHGLESFERLTLDGPGSRNPLAHSGTVARAMTTLLANPPDLLVVQGDTSSALGGAMAGFAAGVILAGTDHKRIVALVMRMTDPAVRATMSNPSLPFGDGQSGPRIAAAMLEWIEVQRGAMRRAG